MLVTGLAYLPAIGGSFIWDDDELVTDNSLVHAPDGLYRLWFTDQPIDYWPMTYTTFWFEWRLWGMNATGYHVTNLALHIAAALLICGILRQLSIPGAFLAALLFAVHPVNVESVAWIAQRKNTLAMVFFLLSILWYLRQEDGRGRKEEEKRRRGEEEIRCATGFGIWYWLSLLAFLLAMLSKGSVAILPVVLLGIVWWRRGRITSRDLLRTAPFFVVAAVLAAVNVWFQKHGADVAIREADFAQRLAGGGAVIWFYLSKALAPIELIFVYPQWRIDTHDLLWWLPLAAAASVTAILWRSRRNRWGRAILFAWGYFCVALVPVMGLTDVYFMKYSLVADHYQYIALIGVAALAAAGWSVWHDQLNRSNRWAPTAVAAIAVGTLGLLTHQQARMYLSSFTLFQTTIARNPECWMAHNELGSLLAGIGRSDAAIHEYREALRFKPDHANALQQSGAAIGSTSALRRSPGKLSASAAAESEFRRGPRQSGQPALGPRAAKRSHRTIPAGRAS